jgi:signal peptidase I
MRRTTALGAVLALGAVAAAVLAARRARLEPMLVKGGSMRPALDHGQRIAVAPLDRPPARGDLVVLRHPRGPDLEVVKRVVGLPGERVRLVAGRLEVDGHPVPEPYLAGRRGPGNPEGVPRSVGTAGELDLRLGPAEYLVLGDHRAASTDGRDFGPVPADALTGRVRLAYWPPRRLRHRG